MRRIIPARLAVAASAALLMIATRPVAVHAAGMTTYRLVNTSPTGAPSVTEVVASVIPPGSVVPPSPDVSPLTILTGSSGFDQDNLKVLLGDGTSPTGDPLQALALDFGAGGFAPGGVLNFSLSLKDATSAPPELLLAPGASNLSITAIAPAPEPPAQGGSNDPGTGGGTPPAAQVPEPVSVLLWSLAAGGGFLRAKVFRRGRRPISV